MDISKNVDQAILETPNHEIRDRVNQLEGEWSESRWVDTHAAAAGLVTLGLTQLFSRRLGFLPAALGNALLSHAIKGVYPLLPLFHHLGARPRAEIDRERYGLEQRLHPRDPEHLLNSGRRHGNRFDRIRQHTDERFNRAIDEAMEARLARLRQATPDAIRRRLAELEKEWDVDQIIEGKTAAMVNLGLAISTKNRRGYLLAGLGFASLLSHSVWGWSPALPVLRRMGFRSRREIDREKFALLSLL